MAGSYTHLLGKTVNNDYRLDALLGDGGMGFVFRASHLRLPRQVAVKLLNGFALSTDSVKKRFEQEAKVTCQLAHPHIVEVYDFDVMPTGEPFIIMELLEGEDLAARLKREGRFALRQATTIISESAEALQAAHDRKVIHRDLKPGNIFLARHDGRDDYVKVMDFGISKVLGGLRITRGNARLGTPSYMSPEQAAGNAASADHRADIFSLGAVAYELLTGETPFRGKNLMELLNAIVNHNPRPIQQIRPDIPSAVAEVIRWAMRKEPRDRPPSAAAFKDAFVEASLFKSRKGPAVTLPGLVDSANTWDEPTRPKSLLSDQRPSETLPALEDATLAPLEDAATGLEYAATVASGNALSNAGEPEPVASLTGPASRKIADVVQRTGLGTPSETEQLPPQPPRAKRIGYAVAACGLVLGGVAAVVIVGSDGAGSPVRQAASKRGAVRAERPTSRARSQPSRKPEPAAAKQVSKPAAPQASGAEKPSRSTVAAAKAAGAAAKSAVTGAKPAPAAAATTRSPRKAPARRRRLWLNTTPAGATVRTSAGRVLGKTPLSAQQIGKSAVSLHLSRTGFRSKELHIPAGSRPVRRNVALTAQRAVLRVVVQDTRGPTWGNLEIDRRPVGTTPWTKRVAPGAHEVRVTRAGYRTVTKRVVLRAGEQKTLVMRLTAVR